MFGKQFGNVFIGVQPTFGYEGDPMRLLFSRSASPHHGFAAYYTFLERIFKARTCVHCCAGWRPWRDDAEAEFLHSACCFSGAHHDLAATLNAAALTSASTENG